MLEILNFIFRDFWTFSGIVVLLYVIGVYCIATPLSAIFDRNGEELSENSKRTIWNYTSSKAKVGS